MLPGLIRREIGVDRSDWLAGEIAKSRIKYLAPSLHPYVSTGSNPINSIDIEAIENKFLLSVDQGRQVKLFDLEKRENIVKINVKNQKNKRQQIPKIPYKPEVQRGLDRGITLSQVIWYTHDTGMFFVSANSEIIVWDTNSFAPVGKFGLIENVDCIGMSPIGGNPLIAASGIKMERIALCDLTSGDSVHSLRGHRGGCASLSWSPVNEYMLFTAGQDSTIRVWDIRKTTPLIVLDSHRTKYRMEAERVNPAIKKFRIGLNQHGTAHNGAVISLATTSDGCYMMSYGSDKKLKLWDLVNFTNCNVHYPLGTYKNNLFLSRIAIAKTDNVAAFTLHSCVGLYDIFTGERISVIKENYKAVNCCLFHPTREEFFTGDANGRIVVHAPQVDKKPQKKSSRASVQPVEVEGEAPAPAPAANDIQEVEDEDSWSD